MARPPARRAKARAPLPPDNRALGAGGASAADPGPPPPMRANGRPPAELERMLRTCLAQLRISPVDEPCEEALMDGTLVQARGLKAGTPVP